VDGRTPVHRQPSTVHRPQKKVWHGFSFIHSNNVKLFFFKNHSFIIINFMSMKTSFFSLAFATLFAGMLNAQELATTSSAPFALASYKAGSEKPQLPCNADYAPKKIEMGLPLTDCEFDTAPKYASKDGSLEKDLVAEVRKQSKFSDFEMGLTYMPHSAILVSNTSPMQDKQGFLVSVVINKKGQAAKVKVYGQGHLAGLVEATLKTTTWEPAEFEGVQVDSKVWYGVTLQSRSQVAVAPFNP